MRRLILCLAAIALADCSGYFSDELGVDSNGYPWGATIKIDPRNGPKWLQLIDGRLCKNGTRQSPVDLNGCDIYSPFEGKPLKVDKFGNRSAVFKMFNTGYTAQINVMNEDGSSFPMELSGGPLDGVYHFLNMHFNWAATDEDGSLHPVRGKYGIMEAHFTYYKSEYGGVYGALDHSNGFAIIAVDFMVSLEDNPELKQIVDVLPMVTKPSPEARPATISRRSLDWADKVLSSGRYKSYPGSFTSTPCNEVVTYIIMDEKVPISSEMVAQFRTLTDYDGNPITQNTRKIRPLGKGRKIVCPRPHKY